MSPRKVPAPDLALILRLLEQAYGRRPWKRWGDPVSILIETILSQNTSDVNSSAGYKQLRRRFRSWDAVASAPVAKIEQCIRVSGLARIKAPRIRDILRQIRDGRRGTWHGHLGHAWHGHPAHASQGRLAPAPASSSSSSSLEEERREEATTHGRDARGTHGRDGHATKNRINLDFLGRMEPSAAFEYLRGFKGVGPKTAACTLLFSLKMPVFPVDTHILRIAKRLGLLPARASAEKAQETLTPLIAPAHRYATHVLLIEHGRKTCRARNPLCQWCPLLPLCPYGKKRTGAVG